VSVLGHYPPSSAAALCRVYSNMIEMGSSGIVRTGGSDGCGAAGDTVTASPEEHEDMPRGGLK